MTKFTGDSGGRGRLVSLVVELSGSNEGHQTTQLFAAERYGMLAWLGDDSARRQMRSGGGSEKEARRRSERGEGIGTGASGAAGQVGGERGARGVGALSSPGEAGEVVGADLAPVATRSRGTGRGGSDW